MSWHAIYNTENGRLVSLSTELDELPEGLAFVECGDELPDARTWDPEKRAFIAQHHESDVQEEEAAAVQLEEAQVVTEGPEPASDGDASEKLPPEGLDEE